MSQPVSVTCVFVAGDADGYALAQAGVAGTALTLAGALVVAGVGTPDAARRAAITSAGGDESGITFAIVGTNWFGIVIGETMTGPGAGLTVISKYDYKTVVSITPSAATAGNVTAGTSTGTIIGSSQWFPINIQITPVQLEIFCTVAASSPSTYTVEFTPDDPNVMAPPGGTASSLATGVPGTPPWPGSGSIEPRSFSPPQPWADTTLFAKSASARAIYNGVGFAYRLTINEGASAVTMQGIQAGVRN